MVWCGAVLPGERFLHCTILYASSHHHHHHPHPHQQHQHQSQPRAPHTGAPHSVHSRVAGLQQRIPNSAAERGALVGGRQRRRFSLQVLGAQVVGGGVDEVTRKVKGAGDSFDALPGWVGLRLRLGG